VLLTVLRLVQGFAVGGEWGGAVLMVSEHSSGRHRGFWASLPQAGVPLGNLLSAGVLAILAAVQSNATFLSWGWRVPFLLSGVLVLVGLWVRLAVAESPLFVEAQRKAAEQGGVRRAPVLVLVRQYWREVLIAMGARFAENISYYVITTFVLVYIVSQVKLSRGLALNALLIASAVHALSIPLWAALSDRIGRRPVYLFGAAATGAWAFAFFALLDTRSFPAIVTAVTVGLVLHGAMYGPQAAFFSEMFGTSVRYSGASIGYQLASVAAGALAPTIATALLVSYHSGLPIAIYVAAAAVVTLLAVAVSSETRSRDLAADPSSADDRQVASVAAP
jgi:MFS family permease